MKLFVTKQEYKNLGHQSSYPKKISKTPQKIKIYNNAHNAYKVFPPNKNFSPPSPSIQKRDKEAEKQLAIYIHHALNEMHQGK
jgi:hypothetical protein